MDVVDRLSSRCRAGVPSCRLSRRWRWQALRLLAAGAAAATLTAASAREGVDVGPPSAFAKAVPAEQIERAATGQYRALLQQAAGRELEEQRLAERQAQVRRFRELAPQGD